MYRHVLRPLLFLLTAERAHRLVFAALRLFAAIPGVARLLRATFVVRDERLVTHAMGLRFESPVGVAAGLDKDAQAYEALSALGFGFVEVGTVTRVAQPGNPPPRLFRLKKDHALFNRMGFNNTGADAVARRLARRHSAPVGVNIGKNKAVTDDAAEADYEATAERLAPYADYLVVNVSSPNTPGLRAMQTIERLRPLLVRVRAAIDRVCVGRYVPLLVKIAPDLNDAHIDAIADLALALQLDGIVATNTTTSRNELTASPAAMASLGDGGISGRPLAKRSLQVLRRLRARVGDRLTLISVGGIGTSGDAWERITAGATLVQVYTAFVYEGPALARGMAQGLLLAAERAGFPAVQAAVGASDSRTP